MFRGVLIIVRATLRGEIALDQQQLLNILWRLETSHILAQTKQNLRMEPENCIKNGQIRELIPPHSYCRLLRVSQSSVSLGLYMG